MNEKLYVITLKRGPEQRICAFGFTEDVESGRTYFHRESDLSDRVTYILTSQIVGLQEDPHIGPIATPQESDYDALLRQARESERFRSDLERRKGPGLS